MKGLKKVKMYKEKLVPLLDDITNKEVEIAGGSVVGQVIAITNSLIQYICNLTIGKEKYKSVEKEVINIKNQAEHLKKEALDILENDKEILIALLETYKIKNENSLKFEEINKNAVSFCINVTKIALKTLELTNKVSKVGNKMLASDFDISNYYAFASVEASIVNVKINLKSINDESFKEYSIKQCNKLYSEALKLKNKLEI